MRMIDEKNRYTPVTVTGTFAQVAEGEYLCLVGYWSHHKTYGKQFTALRTVLPTQTKAIQRYLASRAIEGLGIKTAKRIVDYFGLETLNVLDNTPDRLKEIPNIGTKKTRAIIAGWDQFKNSRFVELFLLNHDLSPKLTLDILKQYGSQAINIVTNYPYRLARDIRGIGFLTADGIAMKLGIQKESPERIEAAIIHVLQQIEDDGHCYQSTEQIIATLQDMLKLTETEWQAEVEGILLRLNEFGYVITENVTLENGEVLVAHYKADLYTAEQGAALKLIDILGRPLAFDVHDIDQFFYIYKHEKGHVELSEEQLNAVKLAATNRVFILTGGPGVGKTTTANMIIKMLNSLSYKVALAAPTGRAAQRLFELTGIEAKTIHRLLEWNPEIHGFNRNSENPLLASAVVVDEASMLDIRLFHALIDALPDYGKLIIIGDIDQLPSVGPGYVLNDLIASGKISYSRLTQIFRQAAASNIVQAAHQINQGLLPLFPNDKENDCRFIEVEGPDEIKGVIKGLVSQILPQKRGFDPISQIQILTPMNRGPLGAMTLNSELQALLNPPRADGHDFKRDNLVFRSGDKVIQTVNNYKLGVFNGDIGYVVSTGVEGGKFIVAFDERQVVYDNSDAGELSLAYAITIHKSQGSEFPVVIIPVSMQHYIMLQRNLVYTALTRARKLAIFVGTHKALAFAVKQIKHKERQTLLADRIKAFSK
jgi:exodeoxyribonuclease V alpha subunit